MHFKIQSIALSYTNNNRSYTYTALTNSNSYNSGDRLFPLNKQTKQNPNCGLLKIAKLPKVRHLTQGPGRIQHSNSKTQVSPVKEKTAGLMEIWAGIKGNRYNKKQLLRFLAWRLGVVAQRK